MLFHNMKVCILVIHIFNWPGVLFVLHQTVPLQSSVHHLLAYQEVIIIFVSFFARFSATYFH